MRCKKQQRLKLSQEQKDGADKGSMAAFASLTQSPPGGSAMSQMTIMSTSTIKAMSAIIFHCCRQKCLLVSLARLLKSSASFDRFCALSSSSSSLSPRSMAMAMPCCTVAFVFSISSCTSAILSFDDMLRYGSSMAVSGDKNQRKVPPSRRDGHCRYKKL